MGDLVGQDLHTQVPALELRQESAMDLPPVSCRSWGTWNERLGTERKRSTLAAKSVMFIIITAVVQQ